MVMTYIHVQKPKSKGHSVQKVEWKQTDGADCIVFPPSPSVIKLTDGTQKQVVKQEI